MDQKHELLVNPPIKKKWSSKKTAWTVAGIICTTSLIVSASVSSYFVLRNKKSDSATTKESTSMSTTTFQTTTIYEIPPYYINREDWGANPPKSNSIPKLELPIKRIIIGHTGGSFCTTQTDCKSLVKSIQTQDSSLDDIPYNFLIGGDGNIYEGRGFNFKGQHTQNLHATEYNSIGICIAFIGNYASIAPSSNQINILSDFVRTFINRKIIEENHIIVSQDDLKYSTRKADSLNDAIKKLEKFRPLYKIYRREEWQAGDPREHLNNFERPMDWILIGHTVTPLCSNLNGCASVARALQNDGFSRNPPLSDILYNIIIGGDGLVFEGRGFGIIGAHTSGYNDKTIGVGVIGEFTEIPPNQGIINAIIRVFDDAVALGKLTDDYKIFGRSDFGLSGPGAAFMNIIREWCRHGNRTNSCDQTPTTTMLASTTSITESSTVIINPTIPYPLIPPYLIVRDTWGANPPKSNSIPMLKLPIERIIIGHTGGNFCTNENDCISTVRSIQIQDSSLDDIAYNFLIGGDGKMYEGRGFNFQGQHTHNLDATEYNSIGICIAFIGNYASIAPNSSQIDLLKDFISTFVEHELITDDHIIFSQDDLKYFELKADALNEAIATVDNFRPLYKIYRREEWNAERRKSDLIDFDRTMDWVLIGHSVTPLCNDLASCKSRARSLQNYDFSRELSDILYNIFFGGDGFAFEGRGWDVLGAHHYGLNDKTIATGVIGDFTTVPPNDKILNAILRVLDDAMALGKLTDDYKIFGRSDFGRPGPGAAFMNIIKEWCRYGNSTKDCLSSTTTSSVEMTTESTELSTTSLVEITTEFTTTSTSTTDKVIIPNHVTRDEWGAQPPRSPNITKLDLPIKRIIIGHTGGAFCQNQSECINRVQSIQTEDLSLDDIAYNFLIGGDGRIYEGRGFNYQGQHTQNLDATEYNSIGICIAFIGNYASVAPNSELINLLKEFISNFKELEIIDNDHIIVLQDDLKYFSTKADALNNVIKPLANFRPLYKIYRREEWVAQRKTSALLDFERIIDWVLIGHSVTSLCNDLDECKSRARSLQNYDFSRSFSDILYNIFFGGDGFAFEGRGWDVLGAHHQGLNDKTIATGVIGNFTSVPPNDKILNAMLQVFDDAMALGKLTDDYKIFGRSDFGGPGPGDAFMNIIKEWCRYGNRTASC